MITCRPPSNIRRVLGDDHPGTLRSAFHLASVPMELGEYQAARELCEDILARRRRVLGDDHPETLRSAFHLASAPMELPAPPAGRSVTAIVTKTSRNEPDMVRQVETTRCRRLRPAWL